MIDKIKDFNKNYSNIVFLIVMIFILISLVFVSFNNRNKPKDCVMPKTVVGRLNAYSYSISVMQDENEIAQVFIKKYDSKYLIELNKDGLKDTYYLKYTDFLKKNSNGKYSIFIPNELIPDIDNKYLIFDYVNDLSLESDIISKDERNCYINRKHNVSMCVNLDKTVELDSNGYKLIYKIDTNYIDDFDVAIEKITLEENVNVVE